MKCVQLLNFGTTKHFATTTYSAALLAALLRVFKMHDVEALL